MLCKLLSQLPIEEERTQIIDEDVEEPTFVLKGMVTPTKRSRFVSQEDAGVDKFGSMDGKTKIVEDLRKQLEIIKPVESVEVITNSFGKPDLAK